MRTASFYARFLGVVALALLMAGCASTPQTHSLMANRPGDLPERVELSQVPFFPQDAYQCGPAALATVMVHVGVQTTPQKLVDMIYLPARKGSLQPELLGATRRYGLVPYQIKPDMETMLREVAHGNPVLVLQNMRLKVLPQWHYAVAVGYDLAKQEIVLRSGDYERYTESFSGFERTWADSGYWGIAVLPPKTLPVTAEEQRYLVAVSALERVTPDAAEQAYHSALARWPNSLTAEMGLGNIAYARKDLPTAEAQYKKALEQHPDAADAWNNLAQILFEQGKKAEAAAAAEKAVGLGGPHADQYRKTLMEISSGNNAPSH